jgi:hypothetical protein
MRARHSRSMCLITKNPKSWITRGKPREILRLRQPSLKMTEEKALRKEAGTLLW